MTELVKYTVTGERFSMSGVGFSYRKAHLSVRKSLIMRLKYRSLLPTDIIDITIKDGSGYFESDPSVFPNYFKKTCTVAEYLNL